MKLASKYLVALAVVVVVCTLLMDMTESQETRRRRSTRRRRRRGGPRGSNRNRNLNRTTTTRTTITTTTTPAPGGPPDGCEEIYLPMCKGFVPYSYTKLPNRFNHTTQVDVYQELEHLWVYMDHACSANTRQLICATYLPKCNSRGRAEGPCRLTCMRAKRRCTNEFEDMFGLTWSQHFPCRGLPRLRCVRPARESRCNRPHPVCINNFELPGCSNVSFHQGTLPNMFFQCHEPRIHAEMEYYEELRRSNCHPDLNFLLCGVYAPYCVRDLPFVFPCQEICYEIRAACERTFTRLYNNLPWPNKLQCHRYPSRDSTDGRRCVMPYTDIIFGSNENLDRNG